MNDPTIALLVLIGIVVLVPLGVMCALLAFGFLTIILVILSPMMTVAGLILILSGQWVGFLPFLIGGFLTIICWDEVRNFWRTGKYW